MITYAANTLPAVSHPNLEVRAVEPPFWHGIPYPDAALCFASALQNIVGESSLDIIHAHYAITHGQAALLGRAAIVEDGRRRGVKQLPTVVITCRGTDVTLFARDSRTAPALRYILTQADGLTFVSEGLRAAAERHLQLARPATVIPNFLPALVAPNPPRSHPFPRSFSGSVVFFHLSRFQGIKNVCWIVRAFAKALARRETGAAQLSLLLIGDGSTRHETEALVGELGIADRVAFLGVVPPEDVQDIIRRADVLLMASDAEGCPRVVLESMTEAKPVIATDVDGLNEMIGNGETGRLCPPGDIDAYAAAIMELADDAETRECLGLNGKTEVERRYNRDAVMSSYEKVYAQALAHARHDRQPLPAREQR
jgi:N-acetyl-alpha-D-glucosaminyl L-malate synthase BshA